MVKKLTPNLSLITQNYQGTTSNCSSQGDKYNAPKDNRANRRINTVLNKIYIKPSPAPDEASYFVEAHYSFPLPISQYVLLPALKQSNDIRTRPASTTT